MNRASSRAPTLLLVLALIASACGGGATSGDGPTARLLGAGATFPEPLYLEWVGEYRGIEPGVTINYQGIGSGGGVEQFVAQTTDFGASDAFMRDDEIADAEQARGCDVLHIPTVFGAVALAYNLAGVDDLTLDAETLAGIFLGEITSYSDPQIAALNPGQALPDEPIAVVHRSDGSGTTSIFTTYLSDVSGTWATSVGSGKDVEWPLGIGGQGNDGVAAAIQQNAGSIGYVELSYALESGLPVASMVNADGAAVVPTLDSTAVAADGIDIPDDLRFDVLGVGGAGYPIVGATWILAYTCGYDELTEQALRGFLEWALTDGDAIAEDLHYAPISDALQARALANVELIGSEG